MKYTLVVLFTLTIFSIGTLKAHSDKFDGSSEITVSKNFLGQDIYRYEGRRMSIHRFKKLYRHDPVSLEYIKSARGSFYKFSALYYAGIILSAFNIPQKEVAQSGAGLVLIGASLEQANKFKEDLKSSVEVYNSRR